MPRLPLNHPLLGVLLRALWACGLVLGINAAAPSPGGPPAPPITFEGLPGVAHAAALHLPRQDAPLAPRRDGPGNGDEEQSGPEREADDAPERCSQGSHAAQALPAPISTRTFDVTTWALPVPAPVDHAHDHSLAPPSWDQPAHGARGPPTA